jgi:hypothetical protein
MKRGALRVIPAGAQEMKARRQNQRSSRNGFNIALLCSVALAFLFPSRGAKGGWMHPELLNNAGVALILFVQGLAMAVERMKAANFKELEGNRESFSAGVCVVRSL